MNNYINQYFAGNNGDALEIRNEATSGMRNPADWFVDWATGGGSDAGVTVNGYTALTHCPLWQGVNIIAGDFGQTPVRLLRNEFDEQRNHPSWNLLRVAPNQLQTPSVWKETMMQWALVWGNGVSWIRRQGSRPVELIPLRPDCLWHEVIAFEDQQVVLYHYHGPYRNSSQYTFFPDEVVHFQGLTSDGIWGYPLWQIARNTIGQGLALEKHGNKQFANGARPSGVLKHPGKMSPEGRANLRNEWNSIHQGSNNSGKVAILWEAMEFQQMQLSNVDAQWIEAKKIGVYEAAALLNLPPHKLGAMEDSSSRANLEEQNADYVGRTLARHYNRADEEYRRKLLTDKEWRSDTFQYKHDADAFLKGDIATLAEVGGSCVQNEIMNRNEARRLVGLPPYSGGEKFGSPAINPMPRDGKKADDNGRPRNQAVATPKVDLSADSVSRIADVVHLENIALQHAAETERNFVGWLDAFYGRPKHRGKVADEFDAVFKDSPINDIKSRRMYGKFRGWCQGRRLALLEVCSNVTRDNLVDSIATFTTGNPTDIARELVSGIFEE